MNARPSDFVKDEEIRDSFDGKCRDLAALRVDLVKSRAAESAAVEELETLRHSLTISVRSKLLLQEAELKVMRLALSMACEDAFSSSSAMASYEGRARAVLAKRTL